MQVKIESRNRPVAEIATLIREHRGDGKTIDSWLNACVDAAHELNLQYYFKVDCSPDVGYMIVAVFL